MGVIVGKNSSNPSYAIKSIIEKINHRMQDWELKFLESLAQYTANSSGLILKLSLGHLIKRHKLLLKKEIPHEPLKAEKKSYPRLTKEQQDLFNKIINIKNYQVILLEGTLGSGKTELYLQLSDFLSQEGQILILLPEILLASQVYERFGQRGEAVLWHSSRTTKEKDLIWLKVKSGKAKIIFGTRSALFLPFNNLRMIIIDEEQDFSYKQETSPSYHARDASEILAKILDLPLLLVSGTPSLESLYKSQRGQYEKVFLPKKHKEEVQLKIEILNLWEAQKKGQSLKLLHPKALLELKKTLDLKRQSLIFLNRKGYAGTLLCSSCLSRVQCKNCSVNLTYYKSFGQLKCRHCNFTIKKLEDCTNCSSKGTLMHYQPGIEKLQEELVSYLPEARIIQVSRDSDEEAKEILKKIEEGEVDIIIGTQILAKGLHFSNMRLCIILDSYSSKFGGDIRALEKSYQILDQVIGRVGRDQEGLALLQTFNKEDRLLQALAKGKKDEFLQLELENRLAAKVPPFWSFVLIKISSTKEAALKAWLLKMSLPEGDSELKVYGPIPANLYFLKREFRYQVLFKSPDRNRLLSLVDKYFNRQEIPSYIKITLDLDPVNFS